MRISRRGVPAAASLAAVSLLAACSGSTPSAGVGGAGGQVVTASCPSTISRRVASTPVRADHRLDVDLSASTGRVISDLEPQVKALVADSVRSRAQLTVSVVGRSAADATRVFSCSLIPVINDPAAAGSAEATLAQVATRAVMSALAGAPDAMPGRVGSDLFGALMAESQTLSSTTPVTIVMLTDGADVSQHTNVTLRLPGVRVLICGAGHGRVGHQLTDQQVDALGELWRSTLDQAGAKPSIQSGDYVAGSVTA